MKKATSGLPPVSTLATLPSGRISCILRATSFFWPTPWVFQVARNAGVDALRARARQERLARLVPSPSVVAGADSGGDIVAALSCLSVKLRESLLLVEVLGLRYREVAQVLGVPEGTVKSRVAQARQRMTAWLAVGERADEM